MNIMLITLAIVALHASLWERWASAQTVSDTTAIDSLIARAKVMRSQNPVESIRAAVEAQRLASRLNDSARLADALNEHGISARVPGDYDSSLALHRKAAGLYEKINNRVGLAAAWLGQGHAHFWKGRNDSSLYCYFKSLSLCEEVENKRGMANALISVGEIYRRRRLFAESLGYQAKAQQAALVAGDSALYARSLRETGIVYHDARRLDSALSCYFRALKLLHHANANFAANLYNSIGETYEQLGETSRAIAYQNKALQFFEDTNDKRGIARTLNGLGELHFIQGRLSEGITVATRAGELAESIGALPDRKKAHQLLSYLYAAQNQPEKSTEFRRRAAAFQDSLLGEQTALKIAEVQTAYENEKRQRDIDLLLKERQLQELKADRERAWFIGGLLAAAAISGAMVIAYMQKRKSERALQDKNALIETQNRQLETQRDSLAEANKVKSELLAIAAHDLKNPLQSIRGFSILIQEDAMGAREMATVIQRASDRMLRLIAELLDSAVIDLGKLELNKRLIHIGDLLSRVVEENQVQASQKHQQFICRIEPNLFADIDAERMRDVLDNLISNAIKYSPTEKTIYVETKKHTEQRSQNRDGNPLLAPDSSILISIRDEGQGLTDDDKKKLFGKFQRLSARPTSGESSTGLGLSIVKQLVELHGGRVWAESAGKDQGTTFFVELPAATAHAMR